MTKCSICDHLMDEEMIAIKINYSGKHVEIKRAEETFGKLDFAICICCWLKSLGIKPINERAQNESV